LEVLPDPEHRITLADEKDAMGIPKPQAHYAIDDYTRKGAERSKDDFRRIASLLGGTNLRFSKEGDYANNQHICGTPTCGTCNSTENGLAIALRTASHILDQTGTRPAGTPAPSPGAGK